MPETQEQEETIVYLGNREAVEVLTDQASGEKTRSALPGKRCTDVRLAPGTSLMDAAHDITHPQGVWAAHSDSDAPAWVASTNPALAQILAAHWKCELREPQPGPGQLGYVPGPDDAAAGDTGGEV